MDIGQKVGDEIRIAQAAVKIYRGSAVGQVAGAGYATDLVPATGGMKFIGVSLETSDNSNGTPGTFSYGAPLTGLSPFVRIARRGLFAFNQTGTAIAQANIGQKVWFGDDNTVTLTPGTVFAGIIVTIDESGNVWVEIDTAVVPLSQDATLVLSGNADAVSPHISGTYVITTAGVDAMTLAAPTATLDDFVKITLVSATANAHTLTSTGNLNTGGASVNVSTFAAHAGAALTLQAYQGKWNVISSNAQTFS